ADDAQNEEERGVAIAHRPACRRSDLASRMIDQADCRNRPATAKATIRSGHCDPVHQTAPAAATTARLPMASLRENSQTARMLASPLRCGISTTAASTLTMNATSAKPPIKRLSGWCSMKTR